MRRKRLIATACLCIAAIGLWLAVRGPSSDDNGRTAISDAGTVYTVNDMTGDQPLLSGIVSGSLTRNDARTLKARSQDGAGERLAVPADALDAVRIGASRLENFMENWTLTGECVVAVNEEANAWVVCGMIPDRNTAGDAGSIVFSRETGEIYYIGRDVPD